MKRKRISAVALLLALLMALSVFGVSASAAPAETAATGAEPVFKEPVSVEGGLYISWEAMSGIPAYRLFRWYDDGRGWVELTDTEELSYTDKNVTEGVSYRYRLAGISASGTVITDTAVISSTFKDIPRITSAKLTADGIRLSWRKPADVSLVAVYRRESGWKRIATTSESSYLDKETGEGGEYTYTVRALNADGSFKSNDYDKKGYTVTRLAVPAVSVSAAADGIRISWKAVTGAELYRVYVKKNGEWKAIGETADTGLTDTSAAPGASYTYTVRCLSADGGTFTSYYDTSGKTLFYAQTPVLEYAEATNNGVKLVWKASSGVDQYRVFRKGAKDWERLGATGSSSFTDKTALPGGSYTYTVRCMDSSENYISYFDREGLTFDYLNTPEVRSVTNIVDGVKITWGAVDGAEKYRVYIYGSSGWKRLAETEETSYTDITVKSGNTYKYTVRCITSDGARFTSGHTSGKSVYYVAAPVIKTLSSTSDGVKIAWDAVDGAGQYRVYYYGSDGWVRLGNTKDTYFIDKTAVSGESRLYTVRCMNSDGTAFVSWYRDGVRKAFVDTPAVSVAHNAESVQVSWTAPEGAELYRVYVKTSGGWKKLAELTENTYEDKSVVSGNSYTYTVRCLKADASAFTSDYDRDGKTVRFVEMPRITSVETVSSGALIKWGAVNGAVKYRVYVKESNGWKRIGETAETSFTDTSASPGGNYTYTVRCVSESGAFESAYDRTGVSLRSDYLSTPSSLKAEPSGNSVKVSWKASEGAYKYRVYVMADSGWKRIGETDKTYFTDSGVTSGKTYRYTVRCINESGAFASDYSREGASCTFVSVPVLKAPSIEKDGVRISWSACEGAGLYRVYYKVGSSWTRLTTTDSLSYKDTTIYSGETRVYTVRCLTADGKAFTSDFDRTGKSIYYVDAPELAYYSSSSKRITISWTTPYGSSLFRVYKKVSGSWKKLTDTYDDYYTDNDVSAGGTYTYTVRCLSDDSKRFVSWYDEKGFTVTAASTKSEFVYYDQGDYYYPYGDDTIAYSGCGPVCFAMIASTITGRSIDPVDAVEWCGNDYYVDHVGTRWDYFEAAADHFGISCSAQYDDYQFEKVMTALRNGKYVISAQSAGLFTRSGHFIVLAGLDSDGNIIVYDPNGWNGYIGTSVRPESVSVSGTQYWVLEE